MFPDRLHHFSGHFQEFYPGSLAFFLKFCFSFFFFSFFNLSFRLGFFDFGAFHLTCMQKEINTETNNETLVAILNNLERRESI